MAKRMILMLVLVALVIGGLGFFKFKQIQGAMSAAANFAPSSSATGAIRSKALTAAIEPGRKSRFRRVATSGPLVPAVPDRQAERDLPELERKPETGHGHKTQQTKEGNI